MKTRILMLAAALALLLVSTFVLADGRPTGIRIGRLVSGGGSNVELDITVTGTNRFYSGNWDGLYTSVWLGPEVLGPFSTELLQLTNAALGAAPLPWGIEWGDGYYQGGSIVGLPLFGPAGGPFTGTFSHTYAIPGTYQVTVGDAYGPDLETIAPSFKVAKGGVPYTGNGVYSSNRYFYVWENTLFSNYGQGDFATFYYSVAPALIAITANAIVSTGAGIPALNVYGLLAMAFVLVGAGLLLFQRPTLA